jgi:hypothetical protein
MCVFFVVVGVVFDTASPSRRIRALFLSFPVDAPTLSYE